MHWMDGAGTGLCVRCRTPHGDWETVPCFYPATIAEEALAVAELLESVRDSTSSLSPRECRQAAQRLRQVLRYGR